MSLALNSSLSWKPLPRALRVIRVLIKHMSVQQSVVNLMNCLVDLKDWYLPVRTVLSASHLNSWYSVFQFRKQTDHSHILIRLKEPIRNKKTQTSDEKVVLPVYCILFSCETIGFIVQYLDWAVNLGRQRRNCWDKTKAVLYVSVFSYSSPSWKWTVH